MINLIKIKKNKIFLEIFKKTFNLIVLQKINSFLAETLLIKIERVKKNNLIKKNLSNLLKNKNNNFKTNKKQLIDYKEKQNV